MSAADHCSAESRGKAANPRAVTPARAPAPADEGAHAVEARDSLAAPWRVCCVAATRAAAVAELGARTRALGADRVRLVAMQPVPPRLRYDDWIALRLARREGVAHPNTLGKMLGNIARPTTRERASAALRRLREAGLLRVAEQQHGPGGHVLTAEGERLAVLDDKGNP